MSHWTNVLEPKSWSLEMAKKSFLLNFHSLEKEERALIVHLSKNCTASIFQRSTSFSIWTHFVSLSNIHAQNSLPPRRRKRRRWNNELIMFHHSWSPQGKNNLAAKWRSIFLFVWGNLGAFLVSPWPAAMRKKCISCWSSPFRSSTSSNHDCFTQPWT